MSLPLSCFIPPMKHTSMWDMSLEKSKNAEDALTYIKRPEGFPFQFPLKRTFLTELAIPLFCLIITKIFYLSIPNTVLLSIMTLTSIITLATSTRALYVLSNPAEYHSQEGTSTFFKAQQRLQKILQCSVLFMHGCALVSSSPSPFLHITIPLLTILCIVWPILPYIGQFIERYIGQYMNPKLKYYLKFPSLPLFCGSIMSLFGSVLHSLLVGPGPWTSYLQLAACVSITLICKDSVTALTESTQISRIKRLAYIILCVGIVTCQFYAVFVNPIFDNIVSALVVSSLIFFVLFRDATQNINYHNSALRFQKLYAILLPPNLFLAGLLTVSDRLVLQQLQEQLKSHSPVASWHFPVRAILYSLAASALTSTVLSVQPASVLLKTFFHAQALSNMIDCAVNQVEISARKQWWHILIQQIKQSAAAQEKEVQEFLQTEADNDVAYPTKIKMACMFLFSFHRELDPNKKTACHTGLKVTLDI